MSIYSSFFGEREWENHSFSFFRKPVSTTEPLRCITIPDIYRYIVGPYAKFQKSGGQGVTIATFFQYAKDAGLSITPPKPIIDSTKSTPTTPHEEAKEIQKSNRV